VSALIDICCKGDVYLAIWDDEQVAAKKLLFRDDTEVTEEQWIAMMKEEASLLRSCFWFFILFPSFIFI